LAFLASLGLWAALVNADPTLPTIIGGSTNVTSFGAVGDGATDNATSIQNAINAMSQLGGGTVIVAAASSSLTNYLSNPITLASSVCLVISNGTKLQMLPKAQFTSTDHFIIAAGVSDVAISGSGTIDGQGSTWWPNDPRPYMVYFNGSCHRVLIENITLQNPPEMHIVFKGADDNITIRGITINTTAANAANTDGIDLVGSGCLVTNCTINAGDDNIAIGSSSSSAISANILIISNRFGVGHGVSIGGNTHGGVTNLTNTACSFNGTQYGIRMKSDDASSSPGAGGVAQTLSYSNITMTNIVHGAIVIYSYYNEYGTPDNFTPFGASTQTVGSVLFPVWRNITINSVTATVASSGFAGIIWGRMEVPVTNLTLRNVSISAPKPLGIYNARGIQLIDSLITIPATTNTINLFNAQVTITNSTMVTNLVKLGGLAKPGTNNSMAFFNAVAAITDTNMLGTGPITLGGSTLSFSQNSVISSNTPITVVSASTLTPFRGTNVFSGALSGAGPLTLNLTNSNIMVTLQGNCLGFTGTLAISNNGALRFDQGANTWGDSNALFDAEASGTINNHSAGSTAIFLGALSGGSGSELAGSDQAGPGVDTYVIGGLNSNTTFAGTITNGTSATTPHTVALTKIGSATFALTGANAYSGGTIVSNGTLLVNNSAGSGTGAGAVTVVSGATLGGSGIIGGPVTMNGTLAPGNSPGTLTINNNLVINSGAVLQYDLGTSSDLTVVSGDLTLNGILDVTDSGGFTNTTYTLFTYSGSLITNGLTIGTTPSDSFDYSINTNVAGQVRLIVSASGSIGSAGPITGPASVNAGDSGDGYSISSVSGATDYTWAVPSGASIASGQGTTSIVVNYGCGASSGNVTVTPSNGSGSGGSSSLAVAVTGVGAAGAISGSSAVCVGQTGDTYSIPSVSGATTYTWVVPSGAAITSGQGTTSITVTWGSTGGNVTVTPANANGCLGAASSLSATVNTAPNITSGPSPQTVCALDTAQFSLSATGGNLTYQWRENGSPLSDGGTVSGSSTMNLALTGVGTGDSGASIDCVVSGSCTPPATSTAVSLTVNPLPTVFNVTGGGAFCNNTNGSPVGLDGSQSGVNYQLQLNGNPTNAPVSGTGSAFSFGNQTASGNYTVLAVDATTGCAVAMNGSASLIFAIGPFQCWQLQYFGCTDCPQAAGDADPDGDGVSNTNEFLSGFNPTNSAAYAHIISIAKSGGDMNVTYLGANGDNTWTPGVMSLTNVLEFTTGAPNGSYSNTFVSTGVTNILSGGNGLGTNVTAVDTGGAIGPTRYYRIRIIAP
jgi:autotransporter-associated beta strand protein